MKTSTAHQHVPACEGCGLSYDILTLDERGLCLVCVAEHKFKVDLEALRDKRGALSVKLKTAGNIDFGQDPRRSLPGVPVMKLRVASLLNASKACRLYIAHYNVGGGAWVGGEVTDVKTKKLTAYVSYNGRLWDPQKSPMIAINLGGAS